MNGDSTDPDSLVPAGGSSLRGLVTPAAEPVVTFIPARPVHPDELWSPRGGELAPPQRPLAPAPDYYAGAESASVRLSASMRARAATSGRGQRGKGSAPAGPRGLGCVP